MYVEESGGAWHPICGTHEIASVKSPMLTVTHKTDQYHEIGKKALRAYEELSRNQDLLRHMGRIKKMDKHIQRNLDDLQGKMLKIESTVAGTEMERWFELKYKRKLNNDFCASQLYMASRTFTRKVKKMAIYIGRILQMTMEPDELHELLKLPERVGY